MATVTAYNLQIRVVLILINFVQEVNGYNVTFTWYYPVFYKKEENVLQIFTYWNAILQPIYRYSNIQILEFMSKESSSSICKHSSTIIAGRRIRAQLLASDFPELFWHPHMDSSIPEGHHIQREIGVEGIFEE